MLRRITLEKGDDPEDWRHRSLMKSTASEFKGQVQKCPLWTTSSPIENEKPTNKHDAANMDRGTKQNKRTRQDFPSRSREALTSFYKAPERYYSEYCPEFLYRIPAKFQLEFLFHENMQ